MITSMRFAHCDHGGPDICDAKLDIPETTQPWHFLASQGWGMGYNNPSYIQTFCPEHKP